MNEMHMYNDDAQIALLYHHALQRGTDTYTHTHTHTHTHTQWPAPPDDANRENHSVKSFFLHDVTIVHLIQRQGSAHTGRQWSGLTTTQPF